MKCTHLWGKPGLLTYLDENGTFASSGEGAREQSITVAKSTEGAYHTLYPRKHPNHMCAKRVREQETLKT